MTGSQFSNRVLKIVQFLANLRLIKKKLDLLKWIFLAVDGNQMTCNSLVNNTETDHIYFNSKLQSV